MISYAQNAEDVVLARLFTGRSGRYVDVGAGHPVEDSVTKHFYDLGWRGINIEPTPALADQLRRERPEDVTLEAAAGEREGRVTLHVMPNWGRSTVDDELAGAYREAEDWQTSDVEVEMTTLAAVLDAHPGPVDFLKVDVEGAELAVVRGADWKRHQPRVVLVEATAPGEPVQTHGEWEPILLAAGYQCALFDGLNRFYAKADDGEALAALTAPANVFDEYERADVRSNRAAELGYVRRLEEAVEQARQGRAEDATYLRKLEEQLAQLQKEAATTRRERAALLHRIAELEEQARRHGTARTDWTSA